jgi:hypothetical protein
MFSKLLEISVNGLGRSRLINPKFMVMIWIVWSAILQKPLILDSLKFIFIVSRGQVKGCVICLTRRMLNKSMRLLPIIPAPNHTNLVYFTAESNQVSMHSWFINNGRMKNIFSVKVSQLCDINLFRIKLVKPLSRSSESSTKR